MAEAEDVDTTGELGDSGLPGEGGVPNNVEDNERLESRWEDGADRGTNADGPNKRERDGVVGSGTGERELNRRGRVSLNIAREVGGAADILKVGGGCDNTSVRNVNAWDFANSNLDIMNMLDERATELHRETWDLVEFPGFEEDGVTLLG